jgi:hypothetical protein
MIPKFGKCMYEEATITAFAQRERVKTRVDVDGTTIIFGRRGHIYELADGVLAVMVMPEPPLRQYWAYAKKRLEAVGCEIAQDCDGEGVAAFDPANDLQSDLAIRVAGIKRRRIPSPAQLLTARRGLAAANSVRIHSETARSIHAAPQDTTEPAK